MSGKLISLAIPKGRLQKKTEELFGLSDMPISFTSRKLTFENPDTGLKAILVKNSDLTTYVSHGIAGMGVAARRSTTESGAKFLKLLTLPFGSSHMCIAGKNSGSTTGFIHEGGRITVATKFTGFTRDYFHRRGIPVQIIKLNGSVELAPILGLAPYIVDIVETGSTLRENNLSVLEELATIQVHLIANPAYYKIHYREINIIVGRLRKGIEQWQNR